VNASTEQNLPVKGATDFFCAVEIDQYQSFIRREHIGRKLWYYLLSIQSEVTVLIVVVSIAHPQFFSSVLQLCSSAQPLLSHHQSVIAFSVNC